MSMSTHAKEPRCIASQRSLSTRITKTSSTMAMSRSSAEVVDEADADPYGWAADVMSSPCRWPLSMRA